MTRRITHALVVTLVIIFSVVAQENFADSLKQMLNKLEGEDQQLKELISIAQGEQNLNQRLAILNIAESMNFQLEDSLMILYWIEKSYAHRRLNNLDSAVYYAKIFDEIAQKNNWLQHRAKACNVIAGAFTRQNKMDSAVSMYQKGLDFLDQYEGSDKQSQKSDILGNLAGVFYYQDDYESAKKYSLQAQEIAEETGNTQSIVYGYARLSILAELSEDLDEAIGYSAKAADIMEKGDYKNDALLAKTYMQIGALYSTKMDYSEASRQLNKAEGLIRSTGNQVDLVDILYELVKVHIKLGSPSKAREMAFESMEIAKETKLPANFLTAYESLIRVEKASNNYTEALRLTEETVLFKDSVKTLETNKQISELQTKYETEKKEAEIGRLTLEGELKDANLARSQNAQIAIAVGGGMTILLLATYFNQRNKKLKAEREAQELQIEALKKRLIDLNISPTEPDVKLEVLNERIHTPLSEREIEVLRLTLEGKTNSEIADTIFVSISTVKFHLRNTYGKLGVNNRKEALDYVVKTS